MLRDGKWLQNTMKKEKSCNNPTTLEQVDTLPPGELFVCYYKRKRTGQRFLRKKTNCAMSHFVSSRCSKKSCIVHCTIVSFTPRMNIWCIARCALIKHVELLYFSKQNHDALNEGQGYLFNQKERCSKSTTLERSNHLRRVVCLLQKKQNGQQ